MLKIEATVIASLLFLVACSTTTTNSGPTAVTGSTAGSTAVGANSSLERCPTPLGTLAVDDGRESTWYSDFSRRTGITSVTPLIRQAAQQSNCFVVTSAGDSRLNSRFQQLREQQRSAEYRAGSNFGPGQAVASDYFLEPSVLFAASDTGSTDALAGAVGGLLGSAIAIGGIASQTKSTSVTMSLFDIRSGVQIAASQGGSTTTDVGGAFGAFGTTGSSALGGAVSAYRTTPEGQQVVAAFVTAYNGMVQSLRGYRAQEVEGGLGRGGQLGVGG